MPDWQRYVQEHLGENRARTGEESEVADELASHLEEYYDALRACGMPEKDAIRETELRAGNWEQLQEGIWLAGREGRMNDRIRQLWIPGLVTLILANVALAILQRLHVEPLLAGVGTFWTLCFYLPWLLMLPAVRAIGAYVSRRAQGRGWQVYLAAVFPALVIGGLFLLILPFALLFDRNVSTHIQLTGVLSGLASWVVLPGMALAAGVAAQEMRGSRRKERHSGV